MRRLLAVSVAVAFSSVSYESSRGLKAPIVIASEPVRWATSEAISPSAGLLQASPTAGAFAMTEMQGSVIGQAEPFDLSHVFAKGHLLRDTNEDGVIDRVAASVVVGDGENDVAAAANVAVRLGYETSALDLPIARTPSENSTPIFVGSTALRDAGITPTVGLKSDEGVVRIASHASRPAIVVEGGGTAGLSLAAVQFGGRMPYAAGTSGATLEKVKDDLRRYLKDAGAEASATSVESVRVGPGFGGSPAVTEIGLTATFTSATAATRAARVLRGLPPSPAAPGTTTVATGTTPPPSFPGVGALRVTLTGGLAPVTVQVPTREKPVSPGPLARRNAAAKEGLDLSTIYSVDGGFADTDTNLIPDRTDLVLVPGGAGHRGVVDLAARIGLESTGFTTPLAIPASEIDLATGPNAPDSGRPTPAQLPSMVLIGLPGSHPVLDRLIKDGKVRLPSLSPGEGYVAVVKSVYGEAATGKSVVVVTGGDAAGVTRAVAQLAETYPHIHARGKDRTVIEDIEEDVRRFVQGRSPEGQAAAAIYKAEHLATQLAPQLQSKGARSAHVTVAVEKAAAPLADLVQEAVKRRLGTIPVTVDLVDLDVEKGKDIVIDGRSGTEEFDIPSEVDDFWKTLRGQVVPAVKKARGKPVIVRAHLSEPTELRRQIEKTAHAELVAAGAPPATQVSVLAAYKPGYSWLTESVLSRLKDKPVARVVLRFAEVGPPPEWKHQTSFASTRWLLEAFPFDEVFARELKLPLAQISFEKLPIGSTPYEVIATAQDGSELLRESFTPRIVVRDFFDVFPEYEKVRVTTGWLHATVAGKVAADTRIVTDIERFWDHFQSKTLRTLHEHVMRVHKGKPRAEDAPFFGRLRIDLELSEPEEHLGVDQEMIAPMEAVHEEIYFNTIHFFDVLGRYTRGPSLNYVGRILPWTRAKSDGKAGHAKITLTGFSQPRPGVVIGWIDGNGVASEARIDIPSVTSDRPQALVAHVRDGRLGIDRLDLRVRVDTDADERVDLIRRTAEDRVDRTMLSAAQVRGMVTALSALRARGAYASALAYHDLRELRLVPEWQHETRMAPESAVAFASNGTPAPWPDIRKYAAQAPPQTSAPIVQWNDPIPPPEAYGILARMADFPEATVYKAGESYLGQEIWAMDLMPKVNATHWSQAKVTTHKPTVIYSARQHANEVSSTSHTLKLAEMLLTDSAYRDKLKKVNAVFHPITNPDGAQLAYDMQKVTPHYMLHAGYLGSLGIDMTAAQGDADPMYPETLVRPALWRTWLPDIFLNPHGYPHHEWVQPFSEYAAWVRTRAVETRDYWAMRGWWMPGFSYLDDPRYPRHKADQFKLRDRIADYIKAAPEVKALNDRAYERYSRYTFAHDQKNFKLDFQNGVLIYQAIKGSRAAQGAAAPGPGGAGSGAAPGGWMARYPNVTLYEGSTEAPDETAHGDWMKLVATAGLQWDKANLDHLYEGNHVVERKVENAWGATSLSMNRPRPPKPAATPQP